MKFLEDNIFYLKDHMLFAVFDEGGVLFNVKDRMPFLLNPTAARMIDLLDGKKNIGDVIDDVAKFYGKPEKLVRDDVENFFKTILERGWLHVK